MALDAWSRRRTLEAAREGLAAAEQGAGGEAARRLRWRRMRVEDALRTQAVVDRQYPGRRQRREAGG